MRASGLRAFSSCFFFLRGKHLRERSPVKIQNSRQWNSELLEEILVARVGGRDPGDDPRPLRVDECAQPIDARSR